MLNTATLIKFLAEPKKIVITTHHKPDGDAMGSSLGLYNYLIQKGHHVKVITPTDYPDFLNWLPGNEEVMIYTEDEQNAAVIIHEAEMIFCLDFNALSRINAMGPVIGESNAFKVLIDHHLEPEDFDDYRCWDINACATAQLVYKFITDELNDAQFIDKDVATCLYTGILTDSASFSLPNTTASVHLIVAKLIEAGAVNWHIYDLIYKNSSESRLRFLGICLSERLEVLHELNTAIISATRSDISEYDVNTGDTEGIVNYPLSVSGIRLAAFFAERDDKVKLSLRSKGEFPANDICKKYFSGGGHRNAAGGVWAGTLDEAISRFKQILPEYKKLLIQ